MEVPPVPPPLLPLPPLFPKCSSHIGATGTGDTTAETGARDPAGKETLKKRGGGGGGKKETGDEGARWGRGVERYHMTLSREILSRCGGDGGGRWWWWWGGSFALERKIGMNISEVGGEGASRD